MLVIASVSLLVLQVTEKLVVVTVLVVELIVCAMAGPVSTVSRVRTAESKTEVLRVQIFIIRVRAAVMLARARPLRRRARMFITVGSKMLVGASGLRGMGTSCADESELAFAGPGPGPEAPDSRTKETAHCTTCVTEAELPLMSESPA
jgi:hypothetical protein